MSKGQRRKIGSLNRRINLRPPKARFTLVCEGRNTEPHYFAALRGIYPNTLMDIDIIPGAGVPQTIATKSIELALQREHQAKNGDSFEERDQIWAVFDRDAHPNFDDAVNRCENKGVRVARSNPCFEVWLILHYEDYNRPDNRHQAQKHFSTLCLGYDRRGAKTLNFSDLIKSAGAACSRAATQLLNREQEGNSFGPPSTTVHELISELDRLKNPPKNQDTPMTKTVHDFTMKTISGEEQSLGDYSGKALLIVNVASACGLTPQYEGLEALQKDYGGKGFAVLGFPCNQFGAQEPGTEDEIATFCETSFGVTFPLFAKLEVNGDEIGRAHV